MALSEAAKEAVHIRRLLIELGEEVDSMKLFNDNNGALSLAMNPIYHSRTKHIDVRYHFVREIVESGLLEIRHVASEEMPADILTKALSRYKHERCVKSLGLK